LERLSMTQPVFSNRGFEQPLEITKGADFVLQLMFFEDEAQLSPYDVTGVSIKARLTKTGDVEVHTDFVCDIVDGAGGVGRAQLSETTTNGLTVSPVSRMTDTGYKWECKVKLVDGTILPYCWGPVRVADSEIAPW